MQNDVGLPPVSFFFTLDQIAGMINVAEETVRSAYIYYAGRTTGLTRPNLMYAINLAADPETDKPEWRVPHKEFVRWLKRRGMRIVHLTYIP